MPADRESLGHVSRHRNIFEDAANDTRTPSENDGSISDPTDLDREVTSGSGSRGTHISRKGVPCSNPNCRCLCGHHHNVSLDIDHNYTTTTEVTEAYNHCPVHRST